MWYICINIKLINLSLFMDIQNLSLKELKPYPLNAKKHPPEQIEKLVRSINLTGFTQPIVVNKEGDELVIIAGHGRYLASLEMNLKEVPCMVLEVPKIVADQARLMDNKSAESDYDIELLIKELSKFNSEEIIETGYDETELNKLILELEETIDEFNDENVEIKSFDEKNQDEIPEEKEVETRVKSGDIWQLGNHYLLCGDCTVESNIKELLGDKKVDMVFTDPPYGISIVGGGGTTKFGKVGGGGTTKFGKVGGGGVIDAKTYPVIAGDDTTHTAKNFYDVCVSLNFPRFIIWGGNYFTDFLFPSPCWIVWDKENTGNFADVELAWCSEKKGAKLYRWLWNGMSRKGDRATEGVTRVHPTQKPVGLFIEIFKDFIFDSCFDGFLGSGTTLIACEKTNRVCYGTELSPRYCDVIVTRWENLTGKTANFVRNIN